MQDSQAPTTSAFLDLETLWAHAQKYPIQERMRAIFHHAGVSFHDEAGDFVSKPRAAIVGIGGLPIQFKDQKLCILGSPTSIEQLRQSIQEMMGFGGFMTYLNPKNASPSELVEKMGMLGHFSTAHTANVNILLLGISCAVENELNCQRDLIHLSRVTVARTKAQDNPPLVVLDPAALPLFRVIREKTLSLLEHQERDRECHNNLFPAAKATMTLLSGTIRNFQKLVSAQEDPGKEREFRLALKLIHRCLGVLVPSMFLEEASPSSHSTTQSF